MHRPNGTLHLTNVVISLFYIFICQFEALMKSNQAKTSFNDYSDFDAISRQIKKIVKIKLGMYCASIYTFFVIFSISNY